MTGGAALAADPVGSGSFGARAEAGRPALWLVVAGALLLAVHAAAVAAMLAGHFRPNIALMLAEGVPYAVAAWLVLSGRATLSLSAILLVALALRLVLLPLAPPHSTDIYRYIWEGRIQAAGFSPYLHVPADPVLAPFRDEAIWSLINRAEYATTIYPPVAQALFFLITRVSESVTWMKTALVAFEGVAVWALVRLLDHAGLPRDRVLIYAWSPLAVWEFAGSGHLDAIMIAFVALAFLASRLGRDALAGAALGCAVLVKFFPLVLAPALWRRWDWKLPAALTTVVALAYAPYAWTAGARVLGFLPTYTSEEGMRDGSGFWLVRLARLVTGAEPPIAVYLATVAAVVLAIALVAAFRTDPREPRPLVAYGLALAATAMLALSPQLPWYFAWLLPFLCLAPSWPLLFLTTASFLLYWDHSRTVHWIADVLYGGTLALLLADGARRALAGRRHTGRIIA